MSRTTLGVDVDLNQAPIVDGPLSLGSMAEDGTLTVTAGQLLAGVSDPDGDSLSVTELSLSSGAVEVTDNGDGTWTFTPEADWNGEVVISYGVSDGQGALVTATSTLSVNPVNDAPGVSGPVDLGSMAEDGALNIASSDLLAHATDVDGDILSVSGTDCYFRQRRPDRYWWRELDVHA